MGNNKNAYSNCKKGWLNFGGGKEHFFRSKWEMNYACYLEWLKEKGEIKDWQYEVDTFWFKKIQRGVRSYTPDFKVFVGEKFSYHEVKGWMDQKSRTKFKRMKKYYPHIKIILVDEREYREVKKWSRLIKGWQD